MFASLKNHRNLKVCMWDLLCLVNIWNAKVGVEEVFFMNKWPDQLTHSGKDLCCCLETGSQESEDKGRCRKFENWGSQVVWKKWHLDIGWAGHWRVEKWEIQYFTDQLDKNSWKTFTLKVREKENVSHTSGLRNLLDGSSCHWERSQREVCRVWWSFLFGAGWIWESGSMSKWRC